MLNALSLSYVSGIYYRAEKEFAQGTNPQSSFYQIAQVNAACQSIDFVINQLPNNPLTGPIKIALQVLSNLSLVWAPFTALVKSEYYKKAAEIYNEQKYSFMPSIPEKLSLSFIRINNLSHAHLGNISQIAISISALALIALGHQAIGACFLAGSLYHYIDAKGYIPHKISLCVITYFPFIASLYTLITLPTFMGAINVAFTGSYLASKFTFLSQYQELLRNKIASFILNRSFIKNIFGTSSCGVLTCYEPVKEYRNLKMEEIKELLKKKNADFEINPAALSIAAFSGSTLKSDSDFDVLKTTFDSINWAEKEGLIRAKLKTDDRFIEMLYKRYPAVSKEEIRIDIDTFITRWIQDTGKTCAEHFKKDFHHLVGVLKKELGYELQGSRLDLDDAITYLEKTIPFFKTMVKDGQKIEIEDFLLKLGVEAGQYCALGIKRAAKELFEEQLSKFKDIDEAFDPLEFQLKSHLQARRQELSNICFSDPFITSRLFQDIHLNEKVYNYLIGFIPTTKATLKSLSLVDQLFIETIGSLMRNVLLEIYEDSLKIEIKERFTQINMSSLILKLWDSNTSLSSDEKAELSDFFYDADNWRDEGDKFVNFVLYSLGIYRLRSGPKQEQNGRLSIFRPSFTHNFEYEDAPILSQDASAGTFEISAFRVH